LPFSKNAFGTAIALIKIMRVHFGLVLFVWIQLAVAVEEPTIPHECKLALLAFTKFKDKNGTNFSHTIQDKNFGDIQVSVTLDPTPVVFPWQINYGSVRSRVGEFSLTDRTFETVIGDYPHEKLVDPILDTGSGMFGLFVQGLKSRGHEVVGVDIAAADEAGSLVKRFSVTDLPFPNNYFSTVISHWSTFAYLDYRSASQKQMLRFSLDEIIRVTRPGGKIFLHAGENVRSWIERKYTILVPKAFEEPTGSSGLKELAIFEKLQKPPRGRLGRWIRILSGR
jgi:SAM-dependent methyltransferase